MKRKLLLSLVCVVLSMTGFYHYTTICQFVKDAECNWSKYQDQQKLRSISNKIEQYKAEYIDSVIRQNNNTRAELAERQARLMAYQTQFGEFDAKYQPLYQKEKNIMTASFSYQNVTYKPESAIASHKKYQAKIQEMANVLKQDQENFQTQEKADTIKIESRRQTHRKYADKLDKLQELCYEKWLKGFLAGLDKDMDDFEKELLGIQKEQKVETIPQETRERTDFQNVSLQDLDK